MNASPRDAGEPGTLQCHLQRPDALGQLHTSQCPHRDAVGVLPAITWKDASQICALQFSLFISKLAWLVMRKRHGNEIANGGDCRFGMLMLFWHFSCPEDLLLYVMEPRVDFLSTEFFFQWRGKPLMLIDPKISTVMEKIFWFNVCSRTYMQINKASRFISVDVLAWKGKREYKQLMLFVLQSIFHVTEGKETFLKFPINLPDLFTSFASLNRFFLLWTFPLIFHLNEKKKSFPSEISASKCLSSDMDLYSPNKNTQC